MVSVLAVTAVRNAHVILGLSVVESAARGIRYCLDLLFRVDHVTTRALAKVNEFGFGPSLHRTLPTPNEDIKSKRMFFIFW